jgi:hypothetical protein
LNVFMLFLNILLFVQTSINKNFFYVNHAD